MECAVAFFLLVILGGGLLFLVSYLTLRQRVKDLGESIVNLERRIDRLARQVLTKEPADSKAEQFVKAAAVHQVPDEPAPVVEPPPARPPVPATEAFVPAYMSPTPVASSAKEESATELEKPVAQETQSATMKHEADADKSAPQLFTVDTPASTLNESAESVTAASSEPPPAETAKRYHEPEPAKEPTEKVAEFLAGHGSGGGASKVAAGAGDGKPFSFEQLLSMKLIVWLAAISVAIAGGLFVKYSAEHGLLSPPVRIAMATVFGVALIVVGHLRIKKNNYIAQGLSAAGVVTLFASVYATVEVFHLVENKTIGFGLMVIVAALAIALSLMHGQLVAAIGLIGGFLTPALIRTGSNDPVALYSYLILLHVAMIAVTRVRGWSILALLTSIVSLLWVVAYMALYGVGENYLVISGFVIASLATTMSAIVRVQDESKWFGGKIFTTVIGFITFVPSFLILMAITAQADFPLMQWVFLGVLSAAALCLARLKVIYEPMSYLAAIFMLAMTSGYALTHRMAPGVEIAGVSFGDILQLYAVFGGMFVLGGYACMWKSGRELRWAIFAAASALLYTAIAWICSVPDPLHTPIWALLAACVSALLVLMAWPIFVHRITLKDADSILEMFASVAALLLFIPCATLNLDAARPMCFGLISFALAAACQFARLPRLRFTMFVALIPQVILLLVYSDWYGRSFGDVLLAYVPTLALAVATIWVLDAVYSVEAQIVEAVAAVMAIFMVYMITYRIFSVAPADTLSFFGQTGRHLTAQIALAFVLLLMGTKLNRRVLEVIGRSVLMAGLPLAVLLAVGSFANGDSFGSILATFFPVPLIAIAVIWHLQKISQRDAQYIEAVTAVFGMFFIHLFTHQLFNHAMQLSISDGVRLGGYLTAQLIYAFALLLVGAWLKRIVLDAMSRYILGMGLPLSVLFALGSYFDHSQYGTIVSVFGPCLVVAAATAWRLDKTYPQLSRYMEVIAVVFVMFFVHLSVEQAFVGRPIRPFSDFAEHSAAVLAQIALAYGLMRLALWLKRPMTQGIAEVVLYAGFPAAIAMPLLFVNPLITGESVGKTMILNQILFVLGTPILMGLWIGRDLKAHLKPAALMCMKICTIVLAFLLITAEIRHAYHLPVLTSHAPMMPAELYAYSMAWLILGGILLALAIITRGVTVRWASLALILLTVAKVFLVDASNLHDLLRVLSFLGLGVALFVVAFVYQRFVFAGEKAPAQLKSDQHAG